MGKVYYEQGRKDEAVQCYRQALRINPHHAQAHNYLGVALVGLNQLAEGAECFLQALRLDPRYVNALINKANVLRNQGLLEEAVACYREVLEFEPGSAAAHGNLVYTLYFCPGQDAESLGAEHRRWTQRFAEPLAKFIEPHDNDPSPERRLRIGYISPDFRVHPIGRFLLPLLEAHDHAAFEIYCYASVSIPDPWTERCQAQADVWREIIGLTDEEVAGAIRRDRIDILVDLTMHMANGRLLVFARKPAPVQVTYLAYPGTTGLDTMDYRLTDPYLDPPGLDQSFYSEESVYLPETYWCYQEVIPDLAIASGPVLTSGQITFGCLNNFCKVTAPTLEAWACLLRNVPGSRLLLAAPTGTSHRDRVKDFFAQRSVLPERVDFVGFMKLPEYFRKYDDIDIALGSVSLRRGQTNYSAMLCGWECRSFVWRVQ